MKTNVEGVETLAMRITALKDALGKLLVQYRHLTDDMCSCAGSDQAGRDCAKRLMRLLR